MEAACFVQDFNCVRRCQVHDLRPERVYRHGTDTVVKADLTAVAA